MKAHQEYQRGLHAFEEWLEQEQEKLGCYTQLEGDVDMLEETLQKLQVWKLLLWKLSLNKHEMLWENTLTQSQAVVSEHIINYVITGTAASLHRGPGFAEHHTGQSRTCHSLGAASAGRQSSRNTSAGVAALPGPAVWHPSPTQQCSGQTSADGAKVPASWQLAKGHGDQSTAAQSSAIRPRH